MEKLFPNKGLIRDWISWEREIYNFLSETHAKSAKFCYVMFAKINRLPKKCHNSEPENLITGYCIIWKFLATIANLVTNQDATLMWNMMINR